MSTYRNFLLQMKFLISLEYVKSDLQYDIF